jgi:hypothetical protein
MISTSDEDTRTLLIPGQCDIREYGAVPTAVPDSPRSSSTGDTDSDVQGGVRRIEAVSRTWSKWGLVIAYMRLVSSHHEDINYPYSKQSLTIHA